MSPRPESGRPQSEGDDENVDFSLPRLTQTARWRQHNTGQASPAGSTQAGNDAAPPVDPEGSDDAIRLPRSWAEIRRVPRYRVHLARQITYWIVVVIFFGVGIYASPQLPLFRFLNADWQADLGLYWIPLAIMSLLIGLEAWLTQRYNALELADRGEQRAPVQQCVACGYSLENIASNRCPECGRAFNPNDRPYVSRAERLSWRSLVRTMTLGVLLSTATLIAWLSDYLSPQWDDPRSTIYLLVAIFLYAGVIGMVFIVGRLRMRRYRIPPPQTIPCPACNEPIQTPVSAECPRCAHALRAEDIFVRCSPWNTLDARYRRLHRVQLWGQLVINGVIFAAVAAFFLTLYVGRNNPQVGPVLRANWNYIVVGMLAVTIGMWFIRRVAGMKWGRNARLLFTQAVPSCPHCDANLSGQSVAGRCPECNQTYTPRDFHG